jgi:2'-5' RNA ligase
MRLFVAIEIPEEIRNDMMRWIATLSQAIPDPHHRLRWVKKDQLHLTLKFLGETGDDQLPALSQVLRSASLENSTFSMSFSQVGHFGGRVIWLGLKSGVEEATRTARLIENACTSIGFVTENRPFQPHITLARSKKNPGTIQLQTLPLSIKSHAFGPFDVSQISLVRSTLTPSGAFYETLAQFPLSGNKNPPGGADLE